MKIIKDSHLIQAMYGRIPQQIPNLSIGPTPEMETIPDEWVMFLNGNLLRKPRLDAVPYLTRKGFKANEQRIKETYIKGMVGKVQNRADWGYYKSNVLSWFNDIETINKDEIRRIELNANKKIAQLKELLDKIV